MSGVYQIEEIKEKLRPVFLQAPVYQAVLFGSYAKGLADAESDVDIVIDSRGELRGINFFGVLEDAVTTLDKDVDLVEISEIRQDTPMWDEIMHRGVVLFER